MFVEKYMGKGAKYEVTEEDNRRWKEIERKDGAWFLFDLIDCYIEEHGSLPIELDDETIEAVLDEYVEHIRGCDYYAEKFDFADEAFERVTGLKLAPWKKGE